MLWLILAFGAALFNSLSDIFRKKSVHVAPPVLVAWAWPTFGLIFLLPVLFFGVPELDRYFWIALVVSGSINTVAFSLYVKALQDTDLSLALPLLTFTPLFLLITSPLILGEIPHVLGLFGVLLIVIGSYVLSIRELKYGYFAPFAALLKRKGSRYMLLVAFLWSISLNFDKMGVQHSSPLFWGLAITVFLVFTLTLLVLRSDVSFKQSKPCLHLFFFMGLFYALTMFVQNYALTLVLVSYVISIKRLSVLFGVLWGKLIFHEVGFRERLLGAVIMLAGAVLITLS